MGEMSDIKHSHKITSDHYVNGDGSVTKKRAVKPCSQTAKFIVNEDGSVTKKTVRRNVTRNISKSKTFKTIDEDHIIRTSNSVVLIGTVIYIIATIIFFGLLVVNTYEEGETISDWVEIFIGLSAISGLLYTIMIRPFLNWLDDLF